MIFSELKIGEQFICLNRIFVKTETSYLLSRKLDMDCLTFKECNAVELSTGYICKIDNAQNIIINRG